jgi:DNA processing protein
MSAALSPNTRAILLLTAPLIVGRERGKTELLTPALYNRVAMALRDHGRQPADLLGADGDALCAALAEVLAPKADAERLRVLLARGFQLSQAIEQWQARAIWVTSRADADYPRRLKGRLKDEAPPVVYGCGERAQLEHGGLAVVGSRHVDDELISYTEAVGRLTARAGRALISGGARGVDQAAMRGALEAQGRAVGVLADSLARAAVQRENRDLLLDERLVLISPYDPAAGFNVGNAMQRNKLVYALADAALVIGAERQKGGTWAGAVEQMKKHRSTTVYVRTSGASSPGLDALRELGAKPWPEPAEAEEVAALLSGSRRVDGPDPAAPTSTPPVLEAPPSGRLFSTDADVAEQPEPQPVAVAQASELVNLAGAAVAKLDCESAEAPAVGSGQMAFNPADALFATVRRLLKGLPTAKTDAEIAAELNVSRPQAQEWLTRLVDEGILEKTSRPVRYRSPEQPRQRNLFG